MQRWMMALPCAAMLTGLAVGSGERDEFANIAAESRPAVEAISADSLRGHLSFLASDALEGRDTPSPGLRIAAEYIAAQFLRAGVQPAGDNGYFQTAEWVVKQRTAADFSATITYDDETLPLTVDSVSIDTSETLDLESVRLIKVAAGDAEALETMRQQEDFDGSAPLAVITDLRSFRSAPREERRTIFLNLQSMLRQAEEAGAVAVLSVDRESPVGEGLGDGRLINPENPAGRRGFEFSPPLIRLHGKPLVDLFEALPAGQTGATISLRLDEPGDSPVHLHNVAGLVRGGDPDLRDEYIIVSAHYDHLGAGAAVDGDFIYNGANDDGSGTVSLIELAAALNSLEIAPKRSILFLAVFGEERGLLGSRYYMDHPLVPLEQTIANVNLEQVGRTDSTEGDQTGRVAFTGYDYSNLPAVFTEAGVEVGVEVYHHPRNSESYFRRSDNVAFASAGIPAHTACVAFDFEDYHGLGDHWDKIDYENMARVNRMLAIGLIRLANAEDRPKWNEDHARTQPFIDAAKNLDQ